MYHQGAKVPKDGTVVCTQHPDITKRVKKDEHFPPCDNWGQSGNPGCTWQYIS